MSRGYWLNPDQIAYIRSELKRGKSHADIAASIVRGADIGVDQSVVSRIATGKRKKNGISCECGECRKCKDREASERYRERKKRDARERNRRIAA